MRKGKNQPPSRALSAHLRTPLQDVKVDDEQVSAEFQRYFKL